ncbi:MAG: hypothetical protein FJY88_00795 [Candidatus Eisenbacteria bacterium]|nr:hypothetical protein [Candidatus Eisenbacteria bacterium]
MRTRAIQEAREALRDGLGILCLDPGSPHLPEPLFGTAPGRDIPEMRLDGLPVGPSRWPETSLSPVPVLAIGDAVLRPYSPIVSPLSSTGGETIDLRSAAIAPDRAVSAVRLTRASYGTFSEELVVSRPIGRFLVSGFYGDSKSAGREPWREQEGQTIGLRTALALGRSWIEGGCQDAADRFRLLSTKRGLWDRTAWSLSWRRPDSAGVSIEVASQWNWTRAGFETALGLTERRSRSVITRCAAHRSAVGGRVSLVTEVDVARTRRRLAGGAGRLFEDLSVGSALGWSGGGAAGVVRASAGITRLAPLAASPVFAFEYETSGMRAERILLHCSRAVRNRTLPRMPADGEAWVLQGLGLASERIDEPAEALWRAGCEATWGGDLARNRLRLGGDLLWMTRTLEVDAGDLSLLATQRRADLEDSLQRGETGLASVWGRWEGMWPFGFYSVLDGMGTGARGGVKAHLGAAALRGGAGFGWAGALFSGDLRLDLSLRGTGMSASATPYAILPSQGRLDGIARARVGRADIYFVLANLSDTISPSMSYEGGFSTLPRRHYRAGVRWFFAE